MIPLLIIMACLIVMPINPGDRAIQKLALMIVILFALAVLINM